MQLSSFQFHQTCPDCICAYGPWTRFCAIFHAIAALVLACVLWPLEWEFLRHVLWAEVVRLWNRDGPPLPSGMAMVVLLGAIQFPFFMAGPFAYLWVVRHRNLHASASKELSGLQSGLERHCGSLTHALCQAE